MINLYSKPLKMRPFLALAIALTLSVTALSQEPLHSTDSVMDWMLPPLGAPLTLEQRQSLDSLYNYFKQKYGIASAKETLEVRYERLYNTHLDSCLRFKFLMISAPTRGLEREYDRKGKEHHKKEQMFFRLWQEVLANKNARLS